MAIMKTRAFWVLFAVLGVVCLTAGTAWAHEPKVSESFKQRSALLAPTLTTTTSGTTVSFSWTSVDGATGYILYYAPYPYTGPDSIGNISVGTRTSMSVNLWEGVAFYVAVQSYDGTGSSGYSNVVHFVLASSYTNKISDDRMLLVLSAPSVHDVYYKSAFQLIVDFQIGYAKAIMGHDNVVIMVNEDTRPYYEEALPGDVLITADIHDIWVRDFTTVNPISPVQFKYTWASMTKQESIETQNSFVSFAEQYDIKRNTMNLLLDGGNIVDNYAGKIVTTTRFMEDNDLTYSGAKQDLMRLLNVTEVAILEPDEEVLAHADGMVAWVDEKTLLVNDYSKDPVYKTRIMAELRSVFPTTDIIEVPVQYTTNPPEQWEGFESACGVNLNLVLTFKNIYVPIFNMPHDQQSVNIIRENTPRNVIPISAEGVCPMGGSVRCLTWQLAGQDAERVILAARQSQQTLHAKRNKANVQE